MQAMGDGSGPRATDARIRLARVDVRLGDFQAATQELKTAETEFATGHGDRGLAPLLEVVRGELALASGGAQDSRAYFEKAAAVWVDDRPDVAAVEARAYLARHAPGPDVVCATGTGVEPHAGRENGAATRWMPRVSRPARCLTTTVRCRRRSAPRHSADGERVLGPELQAQVHYWRSQALKGTGDVAGSKRDEEAAQRFLRDLTTSLPERYRAGFAARADLHVPAI